MYFEKLYYRAIPYNDTSFIYKLALEPRDAQVTNS